MCRDHLRAPPSIAFGPVRMRMLQADLIPVWILQIQLLHPVVGDRGRLRGDVALAQVGVRGVDSKSTVCNGICPYGGFETSRNRALAVALDFLQRRPAGSVKALRFIRPEGPRSARAVRHGRRG